MSASSTTATTAASAASSACASASGAPTLAMIAQRPLKFLPSLLPRVADSSNAASGSGGSSSLRDAHAELAQQAQVWRAVQADLSLLLRLPLAEFIAHTLYNKSLQRMFENALQQLPTLWDECTGVSYTKRWWRTAGADEDAEASTLQQQEQEKKGASSSASVMQPAKASTEHMALLRGLAKRILLVYVRLCATELHHATSASDDVTASSSAASSSGSSVSSPPWLTSLFFTTSYSASPLFSPAVLLDLAAFYSSVSRAAHRPLLQLILNRAAEKLPYAFGQGMQHAVGVLLSTLHTQVKLVHAPYAAGVSVAGSKKARFTREEAKHFVHNLSAILWPLYALCSLRTDVLRLLLQGVGSIAASGKSGKAGAGSSASASSTPPFIALLTCLYSFTPLLLLHELGLKPSQLSTQPELVHLRKGCLKFLDLLLRKALYEPMGLRIQRARVTANGEATGRRVHWTAPAATAQGARSQPAAAADTSSTLPAALSLTQAAETFLQAVSLLYSCVADDVKDGSPGPSSSGLFILSPSLRNLVKFNSISSQQAFLRRANEYFELDQVYALLLKQAQQRVAGSPGAVLGEGKIVKALNILQQVDPQLVRERIKWPPPASASASSASSSSSSATSKGDFDEHKGAPLSSPAMSRSLSSRSGKDAGIDQTAALNSLRDLFPPSQFSQDFLSAALTEFNNDPEQTTKAILEESLPSYLQDVREKKFFKIGDQQDSSKMRNTAAGLAAGVMSRQSSSGFSSGSGLLDQAVDDEDEMASRFTVDVDDSSAFEAFLKRTGRVSKEEQMKRAAAVVGGGGGRAGGGKNARGGGGGGAASVINSFSKEEASLLAARIKQSLALQAREDADENDEFDDSFNDFEMAADAFAVEANDATELEERTAKFSRQLSGGEEGSGAGGGDEPDGSFQRQPRGQNNNQQVRQGQGQQQHYNNPRGGPQPERGFASMRGGRSSGPAAAAGGQGGGRAGGQKWQETSAHPSAASHAPPRTFMPEYAASSAPPAHGGDVREQWRREEQRKELFAATQKAQKAQQLAPSKRTPQQEEDYQHGLRQGLIQNIDAPGRGQQQQQQGRGKGQQQQQQQQQQHPRGGQQQHQQLSHHGGSQTDRSHAPRNARDEDDPAFGPASRGGFSMRGGRGGARGGGSMLSTAAPVFQPVGAASNASVPQHAARPSSAAPSASQAQPAAQASSLSAGAPARWDESGDEGDSGSDDASESGSGGVQGQGQSQGGRGGGRGGAGAGQGQGQSMDLRAKKRKEKNKARKHRHHISHLSLPLCSCVRGNCGSCCLLRCFCSLRFVFYSRASSAITIARPVHSASRICRTSEHDRDRAGFGYVVLSQCPYT